MIPFLGHMLVFGVAFFFLNFCSAVSLSLKQHDTTKPTPWTIDGWFTYSRQERKHDLNQTSMELCSSIFQPLIFRGVEIRDSKTTNFFSDICVTPLTALGSFSRLPRGFGEISDFVKSRMGEFPQGFRCESCIFCKELLVSGY